MRAARQMALTPDLVAQAHRALDDPGSDPTWVYHADEEYDAVVQNLLASHPGGPDTWLFAYGSLIWKPEIEHVEIRKAQRGAGIAPSASGSCDSEAPRSSRV